MSTLKVAGVTAAGFHSSLEERVTTFLQDQYIAPGTMSGTITAVGRRGQIAAVISQGTMEHGGAPMREDAIFRIYSMTKPIVSTALMMLWEQGLFLLEDPVEKYLPEFASVRVWAGGTWPNYITRRPQNKMTILHLLNHTSGLTYGFMNLSNVDYGYRKEKILAKATTLEDFSKEVAQLPLEFDPGERFHYSVATDIVGRLVEVLSGQTLDTYLQEKIFNPLGMSDTSFELDPAKADRLTACYAQAPGAKPVLSDAGDTSSTYITGAQQPRLFSGGGGLLSTVHDYFIFAQMLANKGTYNNHRILGPRTLRFMTQNHLPGGKDIAELAPPGMFSEMGYHGLGFGLGFSVVTDSAKAIAPSMPGEFSWGGMASTAFWVSPEDDDLIVVFMTQIMPSSSTTVRRGLRAVIHSALD